MSDDKMCIKCFNIIEGEWVELHWEENGTTHTSYYCECCYRKLTAATISTPAGTGVAERLIRASEEAIENLHDHKAVVCFGGCVQELRKTISWAKSELANAKPSINVMQAWEHIKEQSQSKCTKFNSDIKGCEHCIAGQILAKDKPLCRNCENKPAQEGYELCSTCLRGAKVLADKLSNAKPCPDAVEELKEWAKTITLEWECSCPRISTTPCRLCKILAILAKLEKTG